MKNNNLTCVDYSKNKSTFMTFGYSSPTDGTYLVDDVEYFTGKDHRTLEQYLNYKDCGLNTMMLQSAFSYEGKEPWADSMAKKYMDLCTEAGIERCIITDGRLHRLAGTPEPIVGEGRLYATQEDLEAYVASCMRDYVKHPRFFGLLIADEPRHWSLPAYGAVYRAIRKFCPSCYMESNLLPYMTYCQVRDFYCEHEEGCTLDEGYIRYLEKFLKESSAEKILTDDYPFMADKKPYRMLNEHMRCVQIIADFCRDHDLRFEAVAQTFGGSANGGKTQWWAPQTMDTMQWQINMYLSFGVKVFSYFTYWRKQCNRTNGEWYNDGTSFMTQDGEKTPLWFTMKQIHEEMQAFAPTMLDFRYIHSTYILGEDAQSEAYYQIGVIKQDLELIDVGKVKADSDSLLILTELVHPETGDHMLSVMNGINPYLKEAGRKTATDFTVDFGSEYTGVKVYYRGKAKVAPLENGLYHSHLEAGYAEYLIPFKK